ncbi:hypothetical protein THII_2847 [Thioploca ingrica]|uniref:Uncharacterized protein n=1 Tax=Thioploca ingrica TaxID=40754 RepID=A0A090AIF2_9GAMM|nr:hypothetical protein THII_2847 [Thioploca ingrica]
MTITVNCRCGAQYNLKDEYSGKTVKCKQCNTTIAVPHLTIESQSDPVFDRDKFLLRQKFAIFAKYDVWNEQGNPILFIERQAHLIRNLFAVLIGIIGGNVMEVLIASLIPLVNEPLKSIIALLAFIGFFVGLVVIHSLLYKRRHTNIYRDDSKTELLLSIRQDNKFELLNANYTLQDNNGKTLAKFRKNYLYNLIRKHWYCYAPNGSLLAIALGNFFGLLRINFIILKGNSDIIIGEFNRKFTLLDRYVLDMTADNTREFDRRIAIALGVLLDTEERR